MVDRMNIAITLTARDGASAPIRAVQASLGALPTAATAATNAMSGLVRGLGAVGLAAQGLRAVTGLAQGLGDALGVGLASDVAESVSKVGVVFGASADQIKDFAATSAQSLGLARGEALATTGMFGNMFKTMGLSERAAATMSIDITKLGADLASFHNIAGSDALDKLRAGLVGEAEPLRALGVLLTEAAVTAKGMQMGLAGANGQLSEAAKVQARYALILEQTKDAQGDFARTSTGMANAQRIIGASFKDIRTQIGERLLPVIAPLVSQFAQALPGALLAAQSFLDRFGEVVGNLGRWLAGPGLDGIKTFIGAISGTWKPAPGITQFHTIVGQIGKGVQFARDAMLTFIGAITGSWAGQASDTINPIHQAIGKIGLVIRDYVVPAIATLGTIATKIFDGDLGGAIQALLAHIGRTAPMLLAQLSEWGQAFVAWVAPFVPPLLEELRKLAGRLFAWAQEQAPVWAEQLKTWARAFVAWVQPMIPPLLAELKQLGGRLFAWVAEQAPLFAAKLLTEWLPAFIGWVVPAGISLVRSLNEWWQQEGGKAFGQFALNMGAALVTGIIKGLFNLGAMLHNAIVGEIEKLSIDAGPFQFRGGQLGLTRIALRGAGGGVGGASPAETAPSRGAVTPLAFQHGGSFLVGGAGGIDNNLVSFRASRGERVTVETPSQQRGSRGDVHVHFHDPVVRSDIDLSRLADLAAARVQQALADEWNGADAGGTRPRALLAPRGAF